MMRPAEILAQARAFMPSRVLLTAAELDLFTRLEAEPASAAAAAGALGTDERALTRLLDALVAMGFLARHGDRYAVSEAGAWLSDRNPESLRASLLHSNHLWESWSGLTDAVRSGAPQAPGGAATERGAERTRAFIGAMAVAGRELAGTIARDLDLSRFRRLLDIGGGPATYTIAFLERNPGLHAVLFDRPEVIPMAEERVKRAGLGGRVAFVAGDFARDALPRGCDLALLSAIIHQNSRDENVALFRGVHRALDAGGVLLVRDYIMSEDRAAPAGGTLFALNMLLNTRGGDTYTLAEVSEDLAAAGFGEIRLARSGDAMDAVVEAVRAGG